MMVTRLLAPFGAEISQVQISVPPGDLARDIEAMLVRRRVVVLRNQDASDGDLVRFLKMLGTVMFTVGETPVEHAPDLNIVSNIGRVTPPRSVFHTDTSYVARPPAYSALRAVVLPDAGGGTLFSDQVRAATELPGHVRQWLQGRTLLHAINGQNGEICGARHPVLRRHPITGEASLFLSTPERCTALTGVDERTSARIVNALYRRSIRARGLYRHDWRSGDIVIWDDRTTMHRADHGAVSGDRLLHRGLVEGEAPIAF